MKLTATGGASLAAQRVSCGCGVERTLASITTAFPDGRTFLSSSLAGEDSAKEDVQYLCQGMRPWLGEDEPATCDRPLRGSLRSASNLYYARVSSSIYLPRGDEDSPSELVSLLEEPPLSTLVTVLSKLSSEIDPSFLRNIHPRLLEPFSDEQVKAALRTVQANGGLYDAEPDETPIMADDSDTAFRRAEFNVLRSPRDDEQLLVNEASMGDYGPWILDYFSKVMLVNKLKETRAFAGFARVFPEMGDNLTERKRPIWKELLDRNEDWLPAYVVYGEGIFLQLDEHRLGEWEKRQDAVMRVMRLASQYNNVREQRRLRDRPVVPRFVLLHTLSHLIMNRLTFECGYSSAALRERLYVSSHPDQPMAGLLIYTAAGDAEGTMGGLVRMGKPGNLEPVVGQALEDALWCSADPVCMETGALGGQGPDSCNLAACHNCALVPETACEEFNRFLDRGVVIGEPENTGLGYFNL